MDDLENTPEFQALVVAATAKPERSMGDSVIAAEPAQWKEVRQLARELLEKNYNQLSLHIYLIQAEANTNGFTGFRVALQASLHLLQEKWDDLYPSPDLDDPDDMYYARVNLVNELSEQPVFLDMLYRLPLVSVRGIGDFSTRDLDICAGTLTGSSDDQARCQEGLIRGAFAESEPQELQKVATALEALPALCRSMEAVFAEKTGQSNVLSLDRLVNRIVACQQRFSEYATDFLASTPVAQTVDDNSSISDIDSENVVALNISPDNTTMNRDMVVVSFNAILLYYQKHEPSSPVRILTLIAREFVDKSFFEILQTMAPGSRDDLSSMLMQLREQALASLLKDSYARYLAGESLPILEDPSIAPVADALVSTDAQSGVGSATAVVSSHKKDVVPASQRAPVINSRQQVLESLQDIETYFIVAEPSSPIPLIVEDIRKLVPKRFMDLVEEFSRKLPAGTSETGE